MFPWVVVAHVARAYYSNVAVRVNVAERTRKAVATAFSHPRPFRARRTVNWVGALRYRRALRAAPFQERAYEIKCARTSSDGEFVSRRGVTTFDSVFSPVCLPA